MSESLKCPCCGAPLEAVPAKALSDVALTKKQKIILSLLSNSYPRIVAYRTVIDAIYFDDPSGGPLEPLKVIRVQITKLRPAIAELGWDIKSIHSQGLRLTEVKK